MERTHLRDTLRAAYEQGVSYLEDLPQTPVGATVCEDELRRRFEAAMPEHGVDPETVVKELVAQVEGGLQASTSGRFFGWVIGGSLPAALAADWLTSVWDQVPGVYAVSPAGSIIEEVCGAWLLDVLGLPKEASYALVTGCQMAHVTCLAAARNALLTRQGWDVEQHGLFGAPAVRIVTSNQRHGTIERAVRMLGFGRESIVDIPVEERGHLTGAGLEHVLASAPDAPTIVLLQAGDVNTGAFDPFEEVIPVARKYDAWVHVDGAFGLWAAASPEYAHLTKGVERADSWATDGHKWLNVPYDCGYAFVANSEAHARAFSHQASYLHQSDSVRDAIDWAPEHSRRARGFATYAALKSLGKRGVRDLVNRCCRHTRYMVDLLAEIPGVEVVSYPIINQAMVRFVDSRPEATAADHDRRTEKVMAGIMASGEALFTGTTWRGKRCMRISVSNWATTEDDVHRAVQVVHKVLSENTVQM